MRFDDVTFAKYSIANTEKYGMRYSSGRIYDQYSPQNHIDYSVYDNRNLIINQLYAEDKATTCCLVCLAMRLCIHNSFHRIIIEKPLDDNVIDILLALGFVEKENNNIRKRLFVFDISEREYFVIR